MRPALLRMAIRYLENSDEAEDAVQDALLKLWFLRDRLDQYRSVDALAIVITKHLCINRLRGTRIEKVDLEQGISIGGGENPEMKLVEEENMQEILEVIGTLPDLQQSILRMKHLEGFEVEEIARLTGSTPVAVRTNLSRARKRVNVRSERKNRANLFFRKKKPKKTAYIIYKKRRVSIPDTQSSLTLNLIP